ncbi:Phosphoglycerate dehydrogenase [Globisporangium polare]
MWRFQRALAQRAAARCARLESHRSFFSTAAAAAAAPEFRILCLDVPQPVAEVSCVQELVQRGHRVDQAESTDAGFLDSIISNYDALLVSPTTKLSRELITKGAQAKLQLVAVPADAIDSAHIDMMEATNQGVLMLQLEKKQVGDKFSVEAEIGLSMLIQLARNIPVSIAATRSGASYQREHFSGTELSNKNLGIVGLGQAGKCVVEMAKAMGLNVFGYDPNLTQEAAETMGVKRYSLDELYANCDFLMFHAPLTARTRGMFNDAALEKCKNGVKIVSVAEYKGLQGLLDEQTLLKGLESGKISGVALDTLRSAEDTEAAEEHSETWKQLFAHSKVITNAHVDGKSSSAVASAKNYRIISENICDALAQRYYRGVANGVFMPLTLLPEMKPYLRLSDSLGRFLHQLTVSSDLKGQITKVLIATSGGIQVDITSPKAKSALQSAVIKGMFESMAQHKHHGSAAAPKVTLINSSMVAMTNGIDVRQGELAGNEVQHLSNSITVEVETASKEKFLVMGSVFGEDPRIVRVNEYTDFPAFRPEGNLLIFNNEDKPGAIAEILQELAHSQINIANFGLSRQANVRMALGILALDSVPSEATLESLKKLPSVQNLQFAKV